MSKQKIAASDVHKFVHYDPATGIFTRAFEKRCGKNNAVVRYRVGDVAGCVAKNGYVQIAIEGVIYFAHRLAVAYMTGKWPAAEVDHIDGCRANNRYANLREATRETNAQNKRAAMRTSLSGLLGAHKSFDKWEARITANGVQMRLGRFDSPEEAHACYIAAKRRLHAACTI